MHQSLGHENSGCYSRCFDPEGYRFTVHNPVGKKGGKTQTKITSNAPSVTPSLTHRLSAFPLKAAVSSQVKTAETQ